MHIPVLKKEVLEQLNPIENENYIDATFGEGGHAQEILERIKPKGKLIGIEKDEVLYQRGLETKSDRLILYNNSYTNLLKVAQSSGIEEISGILFDLGFCTFHIEESKKGFSFSSDEPLDMRYGSEGETAQEIINNYSERELEKILKEYGEERYARKVARKIIEERKIKRIETTFDLVRVIKKAIPYYKSRIHFATRTFQGLRIAVNNELDSLEIGLNQAYNILKKEGKIVVISFHSLEDRIVKNFFKEKNMSMKLIKPSIEEIKNNKPSRSAKLRIGIKI